MLCGLDEHCRKRISEDGMKQNVMLKKLVVKMIPQMRGEEIISENFDKNIFYGPIKKNSSQFFCWINKSTLYFIKTPSKRKLFLLIKEWVIF